MRAFAVALVCLAIAGWADVVSAIFRNAILQLRVPDELRGRMNAIQTAVVAGGPRLGDLESGLVGTVVSPTFSVVSGGLASIAAATIMTLAMPTFWTLRLAVSARPGQVPGTRTPLQNQVPKKAFRPRGLKAPTQSQATTPRILTCKPLCYAQRTTRTAPAEPTYRAQPPRSSVLPRPTRRGAHLCQRRRSTRGRTP